MFALIRKRLSISACAALAIFATGWPAFADDLSVNPGPVGPSEPLLATLGGKRVLAFYRPDNGHCAVSAVMWDKDGNIGSQPFSSSRVRLDLTPGQTVQLDSTGNESLNLRCGDNAASLAISN